MPTAAVLRAQREVTSRFPGVVDMGVVSRRKIAGSDPPRWSQHAYGNAWDIGGPAATREAVYRFLASNRTRLGIANLCYQDRGPCNAAAHQDHVHVDFHPTRRGTPPASGDVGSGDAGAGSGDAGGEESWRDDLDQQLDDMYGPDGTPGLGIGFGSGMGLGDLISGAAGAVQKLTDVEFWKAAAWVLGGIVAIVAGFAILLRDLAIPPAIEGALS